MSIEESVTWVALPAGRAAQGAGACRASVFVAPQVTLVGEPSRQLRLDELAHLADWPATLAGLTFALEVDGISPAVARRLGGTPSSALWRRLFPGSTRVDPFVPDDPSVTTVVQFDTAQVLGVVEGGYVSAAPLEAPDQDRFDPAFWAPQLWPEQVPGPPQPPESGQGPGEVTVIPGSQGEGTQTVPPISPWSLGNLFPPVYVMVTQPDNSWVYGPGENGANLLRNAEIVGGQRRGLASRSAVQPLDAAVLEFTRFADSIRLTWDPATAPVPDVGAEVLAASYDLHRILAALGDHPALLRALGLVIDLEADIDPPDFGRVRVVVGQASGAPASASRTDSTPWVSITSGGSGFAASASAQTTVTGLEPLDRFQVLQLDLESAASALLTAAAAEATAQTPAPDRPLPALRTAGLRLAEQGAATRMMDRAARTQGLRASGGGSGGGTLDADDIQRGHRLDVLDQAAGHWYSLHARRARYLTADGPLIGDVTDEGSCTGSFTGRPLPPGATLGTGDVISVDETLVTWAGWSLAAPRPGGVISADPRDADAMHRAGSGTAIVGRPVNTPLTSTGLQIVTEALPGSLPRLRLGRSYRLRLRSVDLAGNSLTVAQADAAVAGDLASGAPSAAVTGPVTFRRFEPVPPPVLAVVPPAPAQAGGPAPATTGESEARPVVRSGLDQGDETFGAAPGVTERLIFAPSCSVQLAEWHGVFDQAIGTDAAAQARAAAYSQAARESGALADGATEVPWLADPASAGACLSGLPGMAPDDVITVPWTAPGAGPVRLRLIAVDNDEPQPPQVDVAAGIITAFLPPGGQVTAAISSATADLDLMALPALWRERLDAASLAVVEARLARNRHAMVTPTVPVELVHATQRPRAVPAAGAAQLADRVPEQTHVAVTIPWSVHSPSTGTIELEATWMLPRDEPVLGPAGWAAAQDTMRTALGQPALVPAPAPGGPAPAQVIVQGSLDLGSTAHTMLRVRAVATTRFGEFFPPEYGPAPAAGDTPARASRLTAISDEVVLNVLSTRRPPAPAVIEVMPLVVRQLAAGVIMREGGWLRMWLARPWFVTGDGEWPALVAATENQPAGPQAGGLYQISTLVGPDPARGVPLYAGITVADLESGALGDWHPADLAELASEPAAGGPVAAVSDRVIDWDPGRGAWFADVHVDTAQLYFPFVRLALTRHQQNGIGGPGAADEIRVSPVVTLDPVQVLPDRELRYDTDDQGVHVRLSGPSYDVALMPVNRSPSDDVSGSEPPGWFMDPLPGGAPSAARIVVQQRVRPHGDDVLAWQDVFEQDMAQDPAAAADRIAAAVTLPFDPTNPPGEFRVLVLEEDFAFGPQLSDQPEGTRARVTFAETIPLTRAVAPPAG